MVPWSVVINKTISFSASFAMQPKAGNSKPRFCQWPICFFIWRQLFDYFHLGPGMGQSINKIVNDGCQMILGVVEHIVCQVFGVGGIGHFGIVTFHFLAHPSLDLFCQQFVFFSNFTPSSLSLSHQSGYFFSMSRGISPANMAFLLYWVLVGRMLKNNLLTLPDRVLW